MKETCAFCGKAEDTEIAQADGWVPTFYIKDVEVFNPCCNHCHCSNLLFDPDTDESTLIKQEPISVYCYTFTHPSGDSHSLHFIKDITREELDHLLENREEYSMSFSVKTI